MKKIFLASVVIMGMPPFIQAKSNMGTDREARKELRKEKREARRDFWLHSVNVVTENQFYDDFPQAKEVSWQQGRFAEATFRDGDMVKTAYYDSENELVGTTTPVDVSALPAKAQQLISKRYPAYKIEKVILFEDNEANDTDMFLYNSPFTDKDTYFPVISNGSKEVILQVGLDGSVSFFQNYGK